MENSFPIGPEGVWGKLPPDSFSAWVCTATLGAVCTHTEYAGYKLLLRR